MVLLHGSLSLSIEGARDLWKKKSLADKLRQKVSMAGEVDPYFTCRIGKHKVCIKSHAVVDTQNPTWEVTRDMFVCEDVEQITFEVISGDSGLVLGYYFIPTVDLIASRSIKGWMPLTDEKGKGKGDHGELNLAVVFEPLEAVGLQPEVPGCYFSKSEGNKVTLYQDAHHKDGELPKIVKANGVEYRHGKCWEETYQAILDAKYFVYACGWAIYSDISLIRDPPKLTVGELFLKKASEGCRVLLMPWDEMISTSSSAGLMGTHDEENRKLYAGTDVICEPVLRKDDGTSGNWGGIAVGGMWTHHQKSIIVDAAVPGDPSKRRVVAFLGGIDITDGRYDYPEHPLFRTLATCHSGNDFYQNCWTGIENKYGPREPWHDIHMKVEGNAAHDVLKNFEDRWKKQVEGANNEKLYKLPAELFLSREDEAKAFKNYDEFVCQFFRSIDERSAIFDHDVPGVFKKKGRQVDASIHRAYVHQIRRAKKFLYIENQYFIGSSHAWIHHQYDFALHIIPLEIVQKIIEKIEANERFTAYILIPMHPEGVPGDAAVQEILKWQFFTIEMMYKRIGDALKKRNSKAHPLDYLMFFCLGNREIPDGGQPLTDEPPIAGSDTDVLQKSRRCMIYVHSKMMIVDDEYILVGSANINERSMAGTRDTEMAMGSYQPYYTVEYNNGHLPKGDVAAFRKSLWAEHLGELSEKIEDPSSMECVKYVSLRSGKIWEDYMHDSELVELKGHLLPYPYDVDEKGHISDTIKYFPDTKAKVPGATSFFLPDTLTS
ncbi:Phospholipase D alpha 1 [Porphyridium purpureum]|uniref:phospholipase D n=1 Tax=Porphyridium purpureum TaxID=35688 RepID=A0A5J4Z9Z2_PORPP|nr:Phospholipase D alpha 1 [Porphyridium purpureum]|eukprot:POR0140..scf295_1